MYHNVNKKKLLVKGKKLLNLNHLAMYIHILHHYRVSDTLSFSGVTRDGPKLVFLVMLSYITQKIA